MTEDQFRIEVNVFTEYSILLRDEFFLYWSEPNKKGKMRFELEKTWDTKRRLQRWFNNQNKWSNGNYKSFSGNGATLSGNAVIRPDKTFKRAL